MTFAYDATGNLHTVKQMDWGHVTTTYDAANQIQHSEDASGRVTYTFDADGNQQIVEQPNGDRTTNVWDYENRLTATQKADGTNVTMTYTPDNRRVTREEV
jgi:YD repeat-containing protein